jgi:hypothetical protein
MATSGQPEIAFILVIFCRLLSSLRSHPGTFAAMENPPITHFLYIGVETGNEAGIGGKNRVFIGRFEDFGSAE